MNSLLKKLFKPLTGRLARNIYFWLSLFLIKLGDPRDSLSPELYYSLLLFNLCFFIILCTSNTILLIPRLLARKKYFAYVIGSLASIFIFAFLYTWWLKFLMVKFPGIDVFDVSVVSSPLTTELSVASIIVEMQTDFFVMLIWYFGFTGMWYMNDHARKEKLMEEVLKKQIETELNFLKSQINPHFLFNTLNNLYGLSLKKSDEAPEAILKLSSVLRYILYESNVELISFEKEKEIMQAYIDIEMLRLPETGNIQFSIMADHPCNIPPLLWLPVLENVFKHGATMISDEYFIDFRFTIQGNTLTIYSKNNFKLDTQKNNLEKIGGIGLSNLRKRLELLYPGKHTISATHDDYCFYTVNVQITLS